MLTRLIYLSKPALDFDRDQLEALIAPIRDSALKHNAKHHLTSALAYSEHRFVEALEGEDAEVAALMTAIAKDGRHTDIEIIDQRAVANRAFPDWAMAFCFEPDFSASGKRARDLIRYLIEAAQRCNKVRAIPGFPTPVNSITG